MRVQFAEESKKRRVAEARELARSNAEMRRKLTAMRSRTDHRLGTPDFNMLNRSKTMDAEEERRQNAEDEEAQELENLRAMLAHRTQKRPTESGWDASPFVPVPYTMRGIKPTYSRDPWARTAREAWARSGNRPSSAYTSSSLSRLDDGMHDSVAMLFNRRKREDEVVAATTLRRPWDATIWRYTPPALRGLKPVTNEPWARDAGMNEGLAALMLHDQQHNYIEGEEPEEMESWIM